MTVPQDPAYRTSTEEELRDQDERMERALHGKSRWGDVPGEGDGSEDEDTGGGDG